MLINAIVLDSAMTVAEVRVRLARRGLWLDSQQPEAQRHIQRQADGTGTTFVQAEKRLARDAALYGVAIRRQWYANILWYARPASLVLQACANAPAHKTLLEVLNLHEPDSLPGVAMPQAGQIPVQEGVVLEGGRVMAISTGESVANSAAVTSASPVAAQAPAAPKGFEVRGGTRAVRSARAPAQPAAAGASSAEAIAAWPRLDAPPFVPALESFDVVVGFAANQQTGVSGVQIVIPVPQGATTVDVHVDLTATGLDAPAGWRQLMRVDPGNPTGASVTFKLIGKEPSGPEPMHLTTLDVSYVVNGEVCGSASRPIVIMRSTDKNVPPVLPHGTPWLSQPATSSAMVASSDGPPVDLTIELTKPDRSAASGRYSCRLITPHPIPIDAGPHEIDLGDEAKGFAQEVVDRVRALAGNVLIENLLEAVGDLVAEKLPPATFDALRAIAQRVAPEPPAVMIVSADPYVPWELARVDPPLDASRPPFLGAQTLLGRWIRERTAVDPAASTQPANPASPLKISKPAVAPPVSINVRDMAVMAGFYKADSGLQRLPSAEAEAQGLVTSHDALPLAATSQALKQLLDATLERSFQPIGAAGAVHFAGHGQFDPARADSAAMFLSDGTSISSLLFRNTKFSPALQPLIFLNACMIGVGGELLGDMGGFPGNCLRGGFGALLGALWEVNDVVAADIAAEFWRRALPRNGDAAEPVAAILRDLRARYSADRANAPIHTYLSYVYYGHPRLTLQGASK